MSIVGTAWHPRGPNPLLNGNQHYNGRTNTVAVHPRNDQIAYAGAAGGGVWKTADGGATWRPLSDRQPSLGNGQISLAIGEPAAVAIDPADPDVIYAGTGPRKVVSGSAAAVGLFKSTDGGASWVLLGSGYPADNTGNAATIFGTTSALINSIIVDPENPSAVYLAASNGVWRSANGGLDWALGTGSTAGDVRSLVLDRSSRRRARILYAGISGQGVFQSADGGQSWTQILSNKTPAVAAALKPVPGAAMTQVVVDLAPPASPPAAGGIQVLYVAIAGNTKALDPVGLFMSTDQGRTWSQQAAAGSGALGTTQTGFCMALAVDPASPGDGANDVLFLGLVGQGRSADSGRNFTRLAGLHADTHGWGFFSPPAPAPTIVYCVTDGGVARSDDGGLTWVNRNDGGLQTTLIYNLDIKPDATASESAAAFQDNGGCLAGPGQTWRERTGGDGFDIVYSGTTPIRLMATKNAPGSAPQSKVLRSDDDGASWLDVTPFPATGNDSGLFKPQLAADPSSADVFYATSTTSLYQTQDAGTTWRVLTPISARRNFSFGAVVAVAPTDPDSVVVASGQPAVLVSANALGSAPAFTNITRNLPGRPVLRVAFDPSDATVIYAVLGGFAGAGPPGHVFRTTLTAAGWTDISPDLDAPFGALALDGQDTPTTIYAGTDIGGVLRSVDLGATWTVLDDLHFPRAPVTDLVIGRGSQVLQAATFGRGVFQFIPPDWPSIAVSPEAGFDFGTACGDEIVYRTLEVFNVGESAPLVITSVQRLMGSTGFEVSQSPGTPLGIRPGEHVDFTVGFSATTPGTAEKATIRIVTNDPDAPTVDLIAVGLGGTPALATVIAGQGAFGSVCAGEFTDLGLVLNNSGSCPLHIRSITSSSADFLVPQVLSFPLVIAPGGDLDLTLRFQPAHTGDSTGTITIVSDDPASPATIDVSGHAPGGRLTITGTAGFGPVPLGDHARQTLAICNTGDCDLHVSRVAFRPPGPCAAPRRSPCGCAGCTCREAHPAAPGRECDQACANFRILANPFPATVHPGSCLGVLLEYVPTCDPAACCELVIESDDPDLPQRTILVTGCLRRTLRSALKCWAAQELHEILAAGS
jgi:photosystem II stability/assembly factor-like uncharacterized protein